jgi:predicted N-acetyltransferase YhbS
VSDLAVRESHQHRGIGKELLRRTQEASGKPVYLDLIAAPGVENYYLKLGFEPRAGFIWKPEG